MDESKQAHIAKAEASGVRAAVAWAKEDRKEYRHWTIMHKRSEQLRRAVDWLEKARRQK